MEKETKYTALLAVWRRFLERSKLSGQETGNTTHKPQIKNQKFHDF